MEAAPTHIQDYSSSDDESEVVYPPTCYQQESLSNDESYYAELSDVREIERLVIEQPSSGLVEIGPLNEPNVKNTFRLTPGLPTLAVFGMSIVVILAYWVSKFTDGLNFGAFLPASPSFDAHAVFVWHPVLMIIGVILLITGGQVVRTIRAVTILPWGRGDQCLEFLISLCNILGVLALLGGMWSIHVYHGSQTHARFYSLHSWFGLATEASVLVLVLWSWVRKLVCNDDHNQGRADFLRILAVTLGMTTAMCGILDAALCRLQMHGKHDYSSFSSEGIVLNLLGCSIAAYASAYVYFEIKNIITCPSTTWGNLTKSPAVQAFPLKRISAKDYKDSLTTAGKGSDSDGC